MKIRQITIRVSVALLFILWAYAAYSKIEEFRIFQIELKRQVFRADIAHALSYILPSVEILAAGLLCFRTTRLPGLALSTLLMLAFTIYIALVVLNVFGKVPCSCGGILEELGWAEHLIFNLAFLSLSAAGLYAEVIKLKERSS